MEVAPCRLAWIASSLLCSNAWQPLHLPQCSAAHVPKQHICKLASYTSSKYSNPCLPSIDTEDLLWHSWLAWLDVISVNAALRSVKYMLAALDAACMYAAMLWQVLHKVPAVCHSFVTQVEKLMLDSS